MSEIKPIYGGKIEQRTITVDVEVTEKGQVFILLPKPRYQMHRDNVARFMIQDLEAKKP